MTPDRKDLAGATERVAEMLRGYYVSQALYSAARLGIADLLAKMPGMEGGVEELATATGTQGDSLYRLMRALASEGVFEEVAGAGERKFKLNAMADVLRSDAIGTMRPAALLAGETQYKVWTLLKETLKPGAVNGFERVFRTGLFEFLAEHPDLYANFNAVMASRVAEIREALIGACEVNAGDVIVDVGGGLGSVVAGLLEKHQGARGILLETAGVIAEAEEELAENPVKERMRFVAGDFLHGVPEGNVMILVTVLHMFQDDKALKILRHCRGALAGKAIGGTVGRIYIAEGLLKGPNEKDTGKWQDLNMMMMTGGRERTFEEYAGLLGEAGFVKVERKGELVVGWAADEG
ncbi:MAG TPA: methyltransferase [Phycisphaerae bacterium]|jgi:hypothetical protein